MPLIQAHQITKSFKNKMTTTQVLNGIDVQILAGQFVSIMGASGSGKSTLLNILSGIDQADQGQVIFNQVELGPLSEDSLADLRREQMGFIFQEATLMKNLTLIDNIILPHLFSKDAQVSLLKKQAMNLMKRLGIEELADRSIDEASGGQLQRVGICRALMGNPSIIFADEPTGALNSKNALEVMDLLQEIHQSGKAILMVTHDAKMAVFAEKTLLMVDGQIIDSLDYQDLDLQNHSQRLAYLNQRLTALNI